MHLRQPKTPKPSFSPVVPQLFDHRKFGYATSRAGSKPTFFFFFKNQGRFEDPQATQSVCHLSSLSFLQPFKNVKTVLSSRVIKKEAAGWFRPASHRLLTPRGTELRNTHARQVLACYSSPGQSRKSRNRAPKFRASPPGSATSQVRQCESLGSASIC